MRPSVTLNIIRIDCRSVRAQGNGRSSYTDCKEDKRLRKDGVESVTAMA